MVKPKLTWSASWKWSPIIIAVVPPWHQLSLGHIVLIVGGKGGVEEFCILLLDDVAVEIQLFIRLPLSSKEKKDVLNNFYLIKL